mmetsp:Transcript_41601/g.75432  ORF Transcript_41601/g.75432 Transcript_41601/m.75432 type:complete len:970 (-) Transcript_41601:238-3147(-)
MSSWFLLAGDRNPSGSSILDIVLSQAWLFGSVVAVLSALTGVAGLALQKAAHHRVLDDAGIIPRSPRTDMSKARFTAGWGAVLRKPFFWLGLILVAAHYLVDIFALTYAPMTTVATLSSAQVLFNMLLAYGLLNERFTRVDMRATALCLMGLLVGIVSLPRNLPGHVEDFPLNDFLHFCSSLFSNPGFAAFLVVWLILLGICLYATLAASLAEFAIPYASPMLVGLFTSQFSFFAKLSGTLYYQAKSHPEVVYKHNLTYYIFSVTGVLYALSIYSTCEGLRHVDCRFFVPATVAVLNIMQVVQALLFFREWMMMSMFELGAFSVACMICTAGAFLVAPNHGTARKDLQQQLLKVRADSTLSSPFLLPDLPDDAELTGDDKVLHDAHPVLTIMEEHKIHRKEPKRALPLQVVKLHPSQGVWATLRMFYRFIPIAACAGVLLLLGLLYVWGYRFLAFSILTVWGVHNGWKYGLHITFFSYVGQKKMKQYNKVDFRELHMAQMNIARREGRALPTGPKWEDIIHFVILPNYKEDIEVLRLAIRSVAASSIASTNIGIALAMEEREEGAKEKARQLRQEFAAQFRYCVATYHPPGIKGETPGKSSNVKWAAQRLLDDEFSRFKINIDCVVLTVADADSEFHPGYFSALSYAFIHAGGSEDQTPERYTTIWQAPILHYKNYLTQPAIVRLASLFTSQHELANLADPNATRVPYSTYSVSATLVNAVDGWDPDWISEDWHMGIKCFLTTCGRLRIQPIFLAVLNYAPEGQSHWETVVARWTQAKRHALGFSELVFFMDHFPRVLGQAKSRWSQAVFTWRGFWIWSKCLLIHLTMATMPAIGPISTYLMAYFVAHQAWADLNSWTFLIFIIFQAIGLVSVVIFMYTNVTLYELEKQRIDGSSTASVLFRSRIMHFIIVATASFILMPFFFMCGALAEWIAAIKTARTHKFHYEVAMKPNLSANSLNSGNAAVSAVQ